MLLPSNMAANDSNTASERPANVSADAAANTENWAAARAELQGLVEPMPSALRKLLTEEWSNAARFEHASIASFSRFSLELMAVGAPPEFLVGAHRAALDEIRHAELSFALASVYAGKALGPAALPMDRVNFGPYELASIVEHTVEEGCVMETLAALEAQAALERAEPKAVQHVLSVVTRDEQAHATLAFRFVAFARARTGRALDAVIERGFETTMRRVRAESPMVAPLDERLAAHGRLTGEERHALRQRALVGVLDQARGALLASS
ncbi:MAG TPA: hypothetical protein VFQ61_12445 [Polyangiaceae bacterium]|nr:hypothetical protein [Polyangiaceae bacterium]